MRNISKILFSNEVQILANELKSVEAKLESMVDVADQALKAAKAAYDEALGLYSEVNTTVLPELTLKKRKVEAANLNKTVSIFILDTFVVVQIC